MAQKTKRRLIKIKSTQTDIFYITKKNKKNTPAKLKIKKYDKKTRKHCTFVEDKLR